MIEVFFDIETKKLFDQIPDRNKIEDLGVSIVSVYRRELDSDLNESNGEMKSFWEKDLPEMWAMFEGADRVIGFNSIKFDATILNAFTDIDFLKHPHFDILDKVREVLGHRLPLDTLAKNTLGKTKLADGLAAVDWWNKGDEESLRKLKMYCEMDVEVTRDVYDYVLKNKKLKYMDKWGDVKEMDIDFSYPKKVEDPQISLF